MRKPLESLLRVNLQILIKQAIIICENAIWFRLKKKSFFLPFFSTILKISSENKLAPTTNPNGKVFFYTSSRRKDDVRTPRRNEGVTFGESSK